MEIIVKQRGAGKTTELIRRAADCNGYIACANQNECKRVFHHSKLLGIDINFPITFDDLLKKGYHALGVRKVHIDDADLLIRRLTDLEVESISICSKE